MVLYKLTEKTISIYYLKLFYINNKRKLVLQFEKKIAHKTYTIVYTEPKN